MRSLVVPLAFAFLVSCKGGDRDPMPSSSSGDSGGDDTGFVPTEGLLGCPAGQTCTIVVVSQAFDDRLEFFSARGPGPAYRGALEVDFKTNPQGDNSGEFLDEPYGLAIDDTGLSVLLGHYPARDRGSLVHFPHAFLAAQTVGATVPVASVFDGTDFVAPVYDLALAAQEPIFMLAHPSGRLLVGVFDNDLFALESEWIAPGQLLVIDPTSKAAGRRSLDSLGAGGCTGAWSLVPLDDAMDTVALACDGNEGAVVLDVSDVGAGTVDEAAAAVTGCVADVPFADKRVRYLGADGRGGLLLAENTPIATFEDGRLWRFDGACTQLGSPGVLPGDLWEVRQIVPLHHEDGARWLMATGRTAKRGVHVVRDGQTGAELCATLGELDPWWTADDGSEVHPYALAITQDGTGLALGAGPAEPATDAPGYGRVLWIELDAEVDPCTTSPVVSVTDLSAASPVVEGEPATWRRGPNVVLVQEYGG